MADQTPATPRLGAALIIGADAAICVHVHTDPAGVDAIREHLAALDERSRTADERLPVVAVLGGDPTCRIDADAVGFTIPADSVDDLAAAALAVNR